MAERGKRGTGCFPYRAATGDARGMDFWALLECITEQPSPALPDADSESAAQSFSTPLRDFVDLCLQKDPAARPGAAQLADHAWLAPAPGEEGGPGGAAGVALMAQLLRESYGANPPRRTAAPMMQPWKE